MTNLNSNTAIVSWESTITLSTWLAAIIFEGQQTNPFKEYNKLQSVSTAWTNVQQILSKSSQNRRSATEQALFNGRKKLS